MRNVIWTSLFILTCVSCGGDGGGSSTSIMQQELEPISEGVYRTVLRPVNIISNGFIPYGTAVFRVKGDELEVRTEMDDDQRVTHRQAVHVGTRCPNLSDDANGDGFVDYQEALAVVGSAYLPLDNDLSSQKAGSEVYPRGPGMTYSRRAPLSRITADLWLPDENPGDEIMKLAAGDAFGLNGRVVLIHGTKNSALPASVAARPGETADVSLPVVCGVLKKIE